VKVSILGLGYIGLPTAAVLASRQVEVVGVDINEHAVSTINKGEIHIVEPELDILVRSAVQTGYLRAVQQVEKADAFLIAVPTPFKGGHEPDLSYIESAAKAIAPVLEKGNLVILESTSPVGATEKMINWMEQANPDLIFPQFGEDGSNSDISVAHCPERVLPGRVVRELVENDRVVGGVTDNCAVLAKKLYQIFVQGECILTDCRTAELCKLVENSYRDVNIAFANELSLISDRVGVDVWELISLSNRHPRVNILQPGPGVGGHCIAVDPWFIVDSAPDLSRLISTARKVNDNKPKFVISKIKDMIDIIDCSIQEVSIACLGISFKADIDDLRESPALDIVVSLSLLGVKQIYVVEPHIDSLPSSLDDSNITLCDLDIAIHQSDVVVLLVDHSQFRAFDKSDFKGKPLIDTRGIY
jgi:UDP-N-acetyl-D-mannosaminuronic acid dehydrogenase